MSPALLVYGDHCERVDPNRRLHGLRDSLFELQRAQPGLARHSALIGALIETGRLLQGVADAGFTASGHDRRTPATDALGALLLQLGRAVCASWASGFAGGRVLPELPTTLELPDTIELKLPEGYAFYALYPEAYAKAARDLKLAAPPCVIGVRSIGTSLAAVVAAALGAERFFTVRPHGDAFDRRVSIAPELGGELLSGNAHYVIVDEGPGLSGSSFNAVADWLESRGVARKRIAFMPSHPAPPGVQASAAHRQRWASIQKVVADLGPHLPALLGRWAAEMLGPLDEPLVELSAGAWRRVVYLDARDWPAVNPLWERRKYLAGAGGETWLIRFAGVGAIGEHKLARARLLHATGLVPEPRGIVHGFLIERWHGDARKLGAGERPIAGIAHYIGTRARLLRARGGHGASLHQLLTMARRNAALALGRAAAQAFDEWEPRLRDLQSQVVPVHTDNRLDRHEWLRVAGGRLLKCDALDHSTAHDLIGCQDLAWDVAGAAAEFGLDEDEVTELAAIVGRAAGRPVNCELLRFLQSAYLAFRIGHARLSAQMCAGDAAEFRRLIDRAEEYERHLRNLLLESSGGATRREALVG